MRDVDTKRRSKGTGHGRRRGGARQGGTKKGGMCKEEKKESPRTGLAVFVQFTRQE